MRNVTSRYVVWILGGTVLGIAIGLLVGWQLGDNYAWLGAIGAGVGASFASAWEQRRRQRDEESPPDPD